MFGFISRWVGRMLRFVLLRVIPMILIVAIIWSGYQVAQAVVRQVDERNDYESRRDSFPSTATAIALAAPAETDAFTPTIPPTAVEQPTETPEPTATDVSPTVTATTEPTEVPTETKAPSATPTETDIPPTATLEPTATDVPATATDLPTETDVPPTATPEPTATDIPATATDLPTATDIPSTPLSALAGSSNSTDAESDQVVFATNTPRSVIFVTNTPSSGGQQPTATVQPTDSATETTVPPTPVPTDTVAPSATATNIPTETFTATPTLTSTFTPTATLTPTITASPTQTPLPTETPLPEAEIGPLPTPLFPRAAEAGTVINGVQVPQPVELVQRDYSLLNIILLGGDDELVDDNTVRTDTMIIVSINRDTGTVNMLSLPRDLLVYIPTTNGMMERLNVVYGVGEAIGWTDGGFGLLRQTIFYNFGINVHYYAKVNFSGFKEIVDTLGGVDIAVDCAYEDYALIDAELPDGAVQTDEDGLQVVGVGYYEMNGAQALWYARTRRNSSDFDRGRRQQQLLRSIWQEAKSSVDLTNVAELWNQGLEVLETDMQLDDIIGLLPLMLSLDFDRIESFTMIPTYHTQSLTVNGANVQQPVAEPMRQLMEDFYRPPSESQLLQQNATVAVYNGSSQPLWDRVAAERLQWEGFLGYAVGDHEETGFAETILIDYTGQQKGSSLTEIANVLNVRQENIRVEPDPNREADFVVILGDDYNSCSVDGVLPVGQ